MRQTAVVLAISFLQCGVANADIILTKYESFTPDNSWAYSLAVGVGKGNDSTYVPVVSDAPHPVFEGYVFYPGGGPSNPAAGWIHQDPAYYSEDTIRLFRTVVLSDTTQTIPIDLGADDGHSIYENGVFLGGGGFGVPVNQTITLQAHVPAELLLLGYNGPGGWQLVFRRHDGAEFASTPGVRISATGDFAPAPEPSTMAMAASGFLMTVVGTFRKRCLA